MHLSMLIVSLFYVAAVVVTTKRVILRLRNKIEETVLNLKKTCEQLLQEKKDIALQEEALKQEAARIFTLYDMTRTITKTFNEEETFNIFKNKLLEYLVYEDCRLLDVSYPQLEALKKTKGHLILSLKDKDKIIEYLDFEGVAKDDQDKVMILGQQFSLVLRRIRLYQQIEKLAITDSLTEMHTRRHIMERFEEELKRASMRNIQLSFLMIDVDHFKRINDEHGHLTGDQILREIAHLIRENVREIDIIARFGGEEFCVILPDTDSPGARYVAQRIREAVENKPITAYDTVVKTTVSIGMATFAKDGTTTSELVDKADKALYQAKQNGRNRVCTFEK